MILNKIKACIFGHALADAMGVPVEFQSREQLARNPLMGPKGFGTYPVPMGSWSDDTTMALCALDTLANGQVDWDEIMEHFVAWCNTGAYTPTDVLFDIGNACRDAINRYQHRKMPALLCGGTDERSNGNGSLMRIIPFTLYLKCFCPSATAEEQIAFIHNGSALTHAHERSQIGCGIYHFVLWELLDNPCKQAVAEGLKKAQAFYADYGEIGHYARVFQPDFAALPKNEIQSSGYVVHTLEAALWCLLTTESYGECILKAINLGSDTDTTAAVAGGLAGALYGFEAIPATWLDTLLKKDFIDEMCCRMAESAAR